MCPASRQTANSPAIRWMPLAHCIVCRVWSKFGKSRINPVTHSVTPSSTAITQKRNFCPAFALSAGTCSPDSMPPNFFNQQPVARVENVRANEQRDHDGQRHHKHRTDEVVDVLREDRKPREQRVADQRQQHRLAEREDEPGDAERGKRDRNGPVHDALHDGEALDQPARRLAVHLDRTAPEVVRPQARPAQTRTGNRRASRAARARRARSDLRAGSARWSRDPGRS